VAFAGQRIDGWRPHRITRLGIRHVPEGRGIFPSLTVEANLDVACRAAGRDVDAVDDAVQLFPVLGTRLGQRAGTLSGGEQQMLAIAGALLARPRLLMLDEISLGLAPLVVRSLLAAVRAKADEGTALLIVEQYVDMALELADAVCVLERGRVVTVAGAGELDRRAVLDSYLGAARR
jgi:branched-chain amino acid transport system ATP-binding protein